MKGAKVYISLAVLMVLGVAIRSTSYGQVFVDGNVIFPGFDPYYHMHRVFQILQDYPNVPYFDAAMNYPYGAAIIWPPLFDFSIATVNVILGFGPGDVKQVETVAAWIIPVMGCAVVIPQYFLAKRIFGDEKIALVSAGLTMIYPAHVWYSQVGFVDHHTAITLAQVVMCAVFLEAYAAFRAPGMTVAELFRRRPVLLISAPLSIAAGFLVWNGFIFFLAILDLFLLIVLLTEGLERGSKIPILCWASHLVAGILLAPFIVEIIHYTGKPVTAITLSYFHLGAIFAFALLALAVHISGLERFGFIRKRPYNIIAVGLSALAAFYLLSKTGALSEGMAWIMTTDKFMASVQESVPIITWSDFNVAILVDWMTSFALLVPFMLVALAYRGWKGKFQKKEELFLLIWCVIMFIIAIKQRRFGEPFAPAQSILVSYFLFEAHRLIKVFFGGRRMSASKVGYASIAFLILLTTLAHLSLFKSEIQKAMENTVNSGAQRPNYDVRIYDSLSQFRDITRPAVSGGSSKETSIPGVISDWSLGHKILYITGLPVVSNNFGSHIGKDSYADWVAFFMAQDEKQAIKILEKRNIKYVVVDFNLGVVASAAILYSEKFSGYFQQYVKRNVAYGTVMEPKLIRSMFFRLSRLGGSERLLSNAKGSALFVPALDHFRLIVDSVEDRESGYLKVFEYVPGARLSISGAPDQHMEITYKFKSGAGRQREYKRTVTLDGSGHARAILPYSSERPDYGHTAKWIIGPPGDVKSSLFVQEKDVSGSGEVSLNVN